MGTTPLASWKNLADTRSFRFPSPLYPILDAGVDPTDDVQRRIEALSRSGCGLVQLRAKGLDDAAFFRWAEEAVSAARRVAGLRIVVNDRVDLAAAAGADGVHLGQEDSSPGAARRVLGESAIVGLSTHDDEGVRRGEQEPVDYLAIGPIFETRTKANPDPVVGVGRLERLRALTRKPLVAIGGVSRDNAQRVLDGGADAVAVISASPAWRRRYSGIA